MTDRQHVLILDFGGQYAHLITRRVRELGVFSEVFPCWVDDSEVKKDGLIGVILSGGPHSVYDESAPRLPGWVLDLGVPLLGI